MVVLKQTITKDDFAVFINDIYFGTFGTLNNRYIFKTYANCFDEYELREISDKLIELNQNKENDNNNN